MIGFKLNSKIKFPGTEVIEVWLEIVGDPNPLTRNWSLMKEI